MKRIYFILTFCLVLLIFTGCGAPKGSILIKESINSIGFDIEFSQWSKQQTCKMPLNKDNAVQVEIICDNGSISLDIHDKNGVNVYTGNGLEDANFIVKVQNDGEYLITMEGGNASGTIIIKNLSR